MRAIGVFAGIEGLYRGPEAIREWADVIHLGREDFEVSLGEVLYEGARWSWSPSGFAAFFAAYNARDFDAVDRLLAPGADHDAYG